jgi:hypothetical protein
MKVGQVAQIHERAHKELDPSQEPKAAAIATFLPFVTKFYSEYSVGTRNRKWKRKYAEIIRSCAASLSAWSCPLLLRQKIKCRIQYIIRSLVSKCELSKVQKFRRN